METGELSEDSRVKHAHDGTGEPVKSSESTHIVKEQFVLEEHRDIASFNVDNEFNRAVDEENIVFNIPGVPNSTVKRSHGINVQNLIQKSENHPQRKPLQSDLQQHRAFNPFSEESKDAIMAFGNTELCEIIDVEPKSQCRACLTYWSAGIENCTCGHLMEDDTTENKKKISSVLDLFTVPNFYIRKGRPHGHRYGKKGCKEFHTAKQLQRRCRKKHYENNHDRFIRDKFFRKTMIELGRFEMTGLDIDDATLGKLLTEAHREHADYCDREGVSVSQSSLSVVFDGAGKPAGERDVDQSIGFGVTRNTYSAHSKFSENTQAEKMVNRTGKPVGEKQLKCTD